MRRPLLFALLVLLAVPARAPGQAAAPVDTTHAGGTTVQLKAGRFSVAPGRIVAGTPVTVSFRLRGSVESAATIVRLGRETLNLGEAPVDQTISRRWTPGVGAGEYKARLVVRAGGLKRVRTFPVTVTAAATPAPTSSLTSGVFPIRGSEWSFGGEESRFGAGRRGHIHQGQDISAPWGTPLVSPVKGYVYWRKVQEGGAGHYLIIRDSSGADYVFMHLVAGSELVEKGDSVRAGQQIAQVGSTGISSGPHLHFEIWPDGWYAPGSKPVDPLPQLKAWADG